MNASSPEPPKQKSLFKAILLTGLLAGTLDITCAIIHYLIRTQKNPVKIFNYIASAVFGKTEAYADGVLMPVLGLIFHYCVATIFTAFFFLIYPKIKILSKNIVATGLLYGIFVWLVMSFIVVPLSNIGSFPSSVLQSIIGCLILMFAIGLPVSILAYRYYFKK
ncbi:MAG: hypothetical protein ABUT20_19665 [Bacteroidota bacterium]